MTITGISNGANARNQKVGTNTESGFVSSPTNKENRISSSAAAPVLIFLNHFVFSKYFFQRLFFMRCAIMRTLSVYVAMGLLRIGFVCYFCQHFKSVVSSGGIQLQEVPGRFKQSGA